MPQHPSLAAQSAIASLAAGPTFLWAVLAANLYLRLPGLILVDLRQAPAVLIGTFAVMPFGAVFAIVPIMIGSALMSALGRVLDIARWPAAWGVAGGAAGTAIAALASTSRDPPELSFGVAAAGAVCALVARRFASFE
jgi:hypothetical protein